MLLVCLTVVTRLVDAFSYLLTIDNGWREVADTALAFVQRFVK